MCLCYVINCLVAAFSPHFTNELLPRQWQECEGWRHGNRLLTANLGPTPRQVVEVEPEINLQSVLSKNQHCVPPPPTTTTLTPISGSLARSLFLPLCSGEELQSSDIRVSRGTLLFSTPLACICLHCGTAEVNYGDTHRH